MKIAERHRRLKIKAIFNYGEDEKAIGSTAPKEGYSHKYRTKGNTVLPKNHYPAGITLICHIDAFQRPAPSTG